MLIRKCTECSAVSEEETRGNVTQLVPIRSNRFREDSKERQLMERYNLCFSCAFWKNKVIKNDPRRVICNGNYYTVYSFVSFINNKQFALGHGGSVFYFRNIETGKLLMSNNVWNSGDVPEHFRDRLPDTHLIIKASEYLNLHPSYSNWEKFKTFYNGLHPYTRFTPRKIHQKLPSIPSSTIRKYICYLKGTGRVIEVSPAQYFYHTFIPKDMTSYGLEKEYKSSNTQT